MTDKIVKSLLLERSRLERTHANWLSQWEEVTRWILPEKADVFSRHSKTRGESKYDHIFDGSAIHFAILLASALHTMLTNPVSQWFGLNTGIREIDEDDEVIKWLQAFVRRIHQVLNNSNFQTEIFGTYLELVVLGTTVLQILDDDELLIRFKSRPIYEHFIKEDASGTIDTVYSDTRMTLRQVMQKFGQASIQPLIAKNNSFMKNIDKEFTVTHAVKPKSDNKFERFLNTNFEFSSFHILKEESHMLKIGGFSEFPFAIPRWGKISGEIYGRSPSMAALPDVKMINAIMKDTIRAAQKVTDPPLLMPDDGIFGRVDFTPGGITHYSSSMISDRNPVFPLETKGQPRIGFDVMGDVRSRIMQFFFIDQLQLREGPQMTATEVNQRTDLQLRFLAPMLGRFHFELLKPMIARIIGIMTRKKQLPPNMPEKLKGLRPEIQFTSQIAKAQMSAEGESLTAAMAQIIPIAQADPTVMDNFDLDKIARFIGRTKGLPQELFRKEADRKDIRAKRAEAAAKQEQENSDLATAETLGKTAPLLQGESA